jgi:isoaspartyl peptidase/L-asparaginase-like protein (Ntn-hydrolase superfamily)
MRVLGITVPQTNTFTLVLVTSKSMACEFDIHHNSEHFGSAARMAMRILKAGGTAVDAVEAAIKVLEDKEITNAGYGSNLSIDGVVECDATIVDHLGRSGACGATARKSYISPLFALLILSYSLNRDQEPH